MHALASYGVTYDLLVHTRHLKHVKTLLENCPDTNFVIDHMAKPPIASREINEWAQEIKEAAKFPNVYCKLSGLVTETNHSSWQTKDLKPYVEIAFEMFGAGRMMFGSDWSVCLLAATYKQVFDSFHELLANLSDEDKSSVFGNNAVKFYKL
jgi:L-fuconolactonase